MSKRPEKIDPKADKKRTSLKEFWRKASDKFGTKKKGEGSEPNSAVASSADVKVQGLESLRTGGGSGGGGRSQAKSNKNNIEAPIPLQPHRLSGNSGYGGDQRHGQALYPGLDQKTQRSRRTVTAGDGVANGSMDATVEEPIYHMHDSPVNMHYSDTLGDPHARLEIDSSSSKGHVGISKVISELKFDPLFLGQLTPILPACALDECEKPPDGCIKFGDVLTPIGDLEVEYLVLDHGVTIQRGVYGSLWIRILESAFPLPHISETNVTDKVAWYVEQAEYNLKTPASLQVVVPETGIANAEVISFLRANDFEFHHYHVSTGEFVYFKWYQGDTHVENLVPPYATACEGVGVCVLSPDETECLMIWEYGCWKAVTGSLEVGESVIAAGAREMNEEVGVEYDPTYIPRLCGGWQSPQRHDGMMNNSFLFITLRAKSKKLKLDKHEVQDAQWWKLDSFKTLNLDNVLSQYGNGHRAEIEFPGMNDSPEMRNVSVMSSHCIASHAQGKSQELMVKTDESANIFYILN